MSTETEMANMAISNLGTGMEIADLETDQSEEAAACRTFFDNAFKATLKAYDWGFARVYKSLNSVGEDPTSEWGFSYRYPVDCVAVRRILSGSLPETRDKRVPFSIAKDNAGKLIYTNTLSPVARCTEYISDMSLCDEDFVEAFSYKLAARIAPRLTKGDAFNLIEKMNMAFKEAINTAKQQSSNEEQQHQEADSEFIRVRY